VASRKGWLDTLFVKHIALMVNLVESDATRDIRRLLTWRRCRGRQASERARARMVTICLNRTTRPSQI
jgi:hypothetical protein